MLKRVFWIEVKGNRFDEYFDSMTSHVVIWTEDKLWSAPVLRSTPKAIFCKMSRNIVISGEGADSDIAACYKALLPKEQMILVPKECRIGSDFLRV